MITWMRLIETMSRLLLIASGSGARQVRTNIKTPCMRMLIQSVVIGNSFPEYGEDDGNVLGHRGTEFASQYNKRYYAGITVNLLLFKTCFGQQMTIVHSRGCKGQKRIISSYLA